MVCVLAATGGCGSGSGSGSGGDVGRQPCTPEDLQTAERLSGLAVLDARPEQAEPGARSFQCEPSKGVAYATVQYTSTLPQQEITAFYADVLDRDGWSVRPSGGGADGRTKGVEGRTVHFFVVFGSGGGYTLEVLAGD